MTLTEQQARQHAQNALMRIRGLAKTLDASNIEHMTIHVTRNGRVTVGVDQELANTDMLMYTCRCNDDRQVTSCSRAILDAYGNEVA